ncbi:bZIP transcription factor 29-like [Fagus crenata]
MGDTEEANSDMMQRLQSSFGTSSSSILKQPLSMEQLSIPQLNPSLNRARHFQQNFGGDSGKRIGIPPSHPHQIPPISPYSQIPVSRPVNQQMGSQNFSPGPTHSRSLSQPSSFFSLDSLPPLSPSPYRDSSSTSMSDAVMSTDVSMEDRNAGSHSLLPPSPYTMRGDSTRVGESLPPRKAHRRSNSDIPFGFSNVMQSSPPLVPLRGSGGLERSVSGRENMGMTKPAQLVKRETSWERGGDNNAEGMGERKSEGEVVDDLFSAYMNLDTIDALNSSGTDEKTGNENREDLDSRASGTKTNGGDSSDNEAESSVNESGGSVPRAGLNSSAEKREGIKRSAGGDVAPTSRHYRSVSMDSFMEKLQFGDESPKLPPSPGTRPGQLSPNNSIDGNSNAFSLEFGNGEFSGAETEENYANEKLAEIALSDPKLQRGFWQIVSQLPVPKNGRCDTFQSWNIRSRLYRQKLHIRDSVGPTNQNNELKFCLQAMEQQAQPRDALNDALTTEVQRLKLATAELGGEHPSKCMVSQLSVNHQMFQLQQQQHSNQINIHQLQQQQQQHQQQSQQQNGSTTSKPESMQ